MGRQTGSQRREDWKEKQEENKNNLNNKLNSLNNSLIIRGNRVVPSTVREGAGRWATGLADWSTFGVWDFDNRGNLSPWMSSTGTRHSKSGFGQTIPEGVNLEDAQAKIDAAPTILNPRGQVTLGEDLGQGDTSGHARNDGTRFKTTDIKFEPTEAEIKAEKEEKEREEMENWQTKLKETEAAGNRLADRNLIRKNIAALPALMAAGNLGVAEAAKGHAEQTVKAMAHIPQLNLTPMTYQPMINYSLGR